MKKWTKARLLKQARDWYLQGNRETRRGITRDGSDLLMWLAVFEWAGMPWS